MTNIEELIETKAVADILTDEEFWGEIEGVFAAGTGEVTREIFAAGAESASSAGVIVDFDAVHRAALRVTRETSSMYWGLMTETTREGLREALITWQAEGFGKRGLPDLIACLSAGDNPLFSRERAKRIAVTEVTRVFAEGNREAMAQDDAVLGEQWQTAKDELVCEVCGPRHNKIYPKGKGPAMPAHVYCRCSYQPVTADYVRQHLDWWEGPPLPEPEDEVND